jgi:putative ABC transport system permease protein
MAADRRASWAQRLEELRLDLRHAVRSARSAPAFTALTVLTMAIGLGANAAIFGVVNVAVLTPLPFDPEGTLVRVREYRTAPDGSRVNVDASRRTADAITGRPDLFSSSVVLSNTGRALARQDGAVRVAATRVGPGFTRVVGVAPAIGRPFSAGEEREAAAVALISHRLWQTEFAGSERAIGSTMHLDGRPTTIVGVLGPQFHIPYDTDMWLPSRFAETERSLFILARLAAGVSIEQARVALDTIGPRLNELYPDQIRGLGVTAQGAREYFVDDDSQTAMALMGAVALLLLIGGSNVALLMTSRFASRQTEVALRAALGCSRGRQVRQFVTEGLLSSSLAARSVSCLRCG